MLRLHDGGGTMDRRRMLQGAGLAVLGSGFFSRLDRVAAMQPAPTGLTASLKREAGTKSERLFVSRKSGDEGPPEPATYDRLPLEWNRRTVDRFKKLLAARDISAFLVRDP